MQAQACLRELLCYVIDDLVKETHAEEELLITEGAIPLAVQGVIHFLKTDVLEAEDARNVVEGDEDTVHSTHTNLQRVFEHCRSNHVVILALE